MRLDQLLLDRALAQDLSAAQAMILAGEVYLNGERADKPGSRFSPSVTLHLREKCPYVSRGGVKLAAGLDHFQISVEGAVCADLGASSGGFTDCLLQRGAKRVFAVDVGYGQLAWKLRQDPRVKVIERFNARRITPTEIDNAPLDLAVLDLSFISLTTILPAVFRLFPDKLAVVALIKPQFELPREDVEAGGVVKSPLLHQQAVEKIEDFVRSAALTSHGTMVSPITGPKGNREFLIYITSTNNQNRP
ncbi:MAG: TlyA family RNA methyltransferase [Desulforhopalus sp.]|nr:TlyA family RNA methyltransferase [Desulforhopalus sp.]